MQPHPYQLKLSESHRESQETSTSSTSKSNNFRPKPKNPNQSRGLPLQQGSMPSSSFHDVFLQMILNTDAENVLALPTFEETPMSIEDCQEIIDKALEDTEEDKGEPRCCHDPLFRYEAKQPQSCLHTSFRCEELGSAAPSSRANIDANMPVQHHLQTSHSPNESLFDDIIKLRIRAADLSDLQLSRLSQHSNQKNSPAQSTSNSQPEEEEVIATHLM